MNAPSDRTSEGSGKDILVIDDTPDNLRFLSSLLTEAGYTVRKVISGELGLEAAQLQPPDLILLDIMMSGMNGYEVCQRMKANDRTRDVPIIFLSALDEELEKVQAFQIGGVDYVTKPFQVVEVLARIETHLKISRLQQQLQRQNAQLQQEIEFRTSAEAALQLLKQGLDAHVQGYTTELRSSNDQLLRQQAELKAALEQKEKQNIIQSQAIEALVQDLQANLLIIWNAIERFQQKPSVLNDENNRSLQQIIHSTQKIEHAIDKASTTIQLTSTELRFHPVPLDLTQFCRNFVNQWQLPENSPHSLNFLPKNQPSSSILADPELLQQLLTHLISNGIRFSPEGGSILIELSKEPHNALLRIQDEGIGIPPDELEQIFDRLYCASNAKSLAGTGMGLALVKQIIELHGGSIAIKSELGKGTTVIVTLPL
jgi:two-component system sensor histidine kinase/response regulator